MDRHEIQLEYQELPQQGAAQRSLCLVLISMLNKDGEHSYLFNSSAANSSPHQISYKQYLVGSC